MADTKRKMRSWEDIENHYPLLEALAAGEAEEGERARASVLVRRAIREYLEKIGVSTLRDAELRAITIRRQRAEMLQGPKVRGKREHGTRATGKTD